MKVVLVTRQHCGLCDQAALALGELGVPFESVNVDSDERLLEQYDEAVPVILANGREVARAPIDREVLRSALAKANLVSGV
jgi:glutaredoxin